MTKEEISEKVYYHVVQGSRYIFSDERNKKRFLDVVAETQGKEEWQIYAFCIMDEQAYFIIEAPCQEIVLDGMHRAERSYVYLYHQAPGRFGCIPVPAFGEEITAELGSLDEIADSCRQIHRIPLEKGYVHRISDYWWSSYMTYIGNYDWKIVNCRNLLSYFSENEETARRKLQRYHTVSYKKCLATGREYRSKVKPMFFLRKTKVYDKENETC